MQDRVQANFERIIKWEISYTSTQLGMNLLLARMQNNYKLQPSSSTIRQSMNEINDFVNRYNKMLIKELEFIENL